MIKPQSMALFMFAMIVMVIMIIFHFERLLDYLRDEEQFHLNKATFSKLSSKDNVLNTYSESEKDNFVDEILYSFRSYDKIIGGDRLGVICYISGGENQIFHFLPLLYGSWKYITSNSKKLLSTQQQSSMLHIDLLAFCHPDVCAAIHQGCKNYTNKDTMNDPNTPTCWAIEQPFESSVAYGPINSFIMFNRTDIFSILKPYKYIMRTDYDVFLTPMALLWRPNKEMIVGEGGYCDPFNMKRLKSIAKNLGLTHRGVHCVGSTWVGHTRKFVKIAKKTLEITAYMFLNEFNAKLPGLETIDFEKEPDGEWIRWWRPVSSLYGSELAMNHLVVNFSQEYIGPLDGSSCDTTKTVWEIPHVHCWHSDCEFQKFYFVDHIWQAIHRIGVLDAKIVHKIIENTYEKDVSNMTLQDYSVYIAWHSVGKHFRKWFIT